MTAVPSRRRKIYKPDSGIWFCRCSVGSMRAPEEDYCTACHAIRPGAGVPMPVMHTLTIPITCPRLNQFRGRHWSVERKYKQLFIQHLSLAKVTARTPEATGKRRVYLTILLAPRKRGGDPDSYFKVLLDSLKQCKLLKDDSPKWVELAPVQYERAATGGSVIGLEEIA